MWLNNLCSGDVKKKKARRIGRGIGSGLGKTCGRGHKGQKARAGGFHKVGFEGGQMPMHRRLPKRGFVSLASKIGVRLSDLDKLSSEEVTPLVLKVSGLVPRNSASAKIYLSGKISRKLVLGGLKVTKGVRAAIEAAGGSVI